MKKFKLTVAVIFLIGFLGAGYAPAEHIDSSQHADHPIMPLCVFLSLRKTLNDLIYIDQILGNEIPRLLTDTNYLYGSWRSYGGSYYKSEWNYQSKKGIGEKAAYEGQHTGIWNLYSAVQALAGKMAAVSEEASNLEKEWWSVRRAVKKELDSGGTGVKSAPRLDKLRKKLAGLSLRYNDINSQVPGLQDQLDYTRSGYLQYINSAAADASNTNNSGAPADIPEPWHWYYRNSQTPRPQMNYNFGESYGKYFEMSHDELHTGIPTSRRGAGNEK